MLKLCYLNVFSCHKFYIQYYIRDKEVTYKGVNIKKFIECDPGLELTLVRHMTHAY